MLIHSWLSVPLDYYHIISEALVSILVLYPFTTVSFCGSWFVGTIPDPSWLLTGFRMITTTRVRCRLCDSEKRRIFISLSLSQIISSYINLDLYHPRDQTSTFYVLNDQLRRRHQKSKKEESLIEILTYLVEPPTYQGLLPIRKGMSSERGSSFLFIIGGYASFPL